MLREQKNQFHSCGPCRFSFCLQLWQSKRDNAKPPFKQETYYSYPRGFLLQTNVICISTVVLSNLILNCIWIEYSSLLSYGWFMHCQYIAEEDYGMWWSWNSPILFVSSGSDLKSCRWKLQNGRSNNNSRDILPRCPIQSPWSHGMEKKVLIVNCGPTK